MIYFSELRICYYVSWSQYRNDIGKYKAEHVDPFLCTHIIYSFPKMDENTFEVSYFEWNDDGKCRDFKSFEFSHENIYSPKVWWFHYQIVCSWNPCWVCMGTFHKFLINNDAFLLFNNAETLKIKDIFHCNEGNNFGFNCLETTEKLVCTNAHIILIMYSRLWWIYLYWSIPPFSIYCNTVKWKF